MLGVLTCGGCPYFEFPSSGLTFGTHGSIASHRMAYLVWFPAAVLLASEYLMMHVSVLLILGCLVDLSGNCSRTDLWWLFTTFAHDPFLLL